MASPEVGRAGAPSHGGPPKSAEAMRRALLLQWNAYVYGLRPMEPDLTPLLVRIAEALERLAPPVAAAPSFERARLFRHYPDTGAFHPAPDYPLTLDNLVGVDRQKARFLENLERFSGGLPYNHALLWGVRGTGKSS